MVLSRGFITIEDFDSTPDTPKTILSRNSAYKHFSKTMELPKTKDP